MDDGSGTCRVETGDLTGGTGTWSFEATTTAALAFVRMRLALAPRAFRVSNPAGASRRFPFNAG